MSMRFASGLSLLTSVILWIPSLCFGQNAAPQAPATASSQSISLEEVVASVKDGMPESLIVARLKRVNKPFDLSPAEYAELRRLGVSDTLMNYLIDPSQPYPPPTAGAAGAASAALSSSPPSPSKPPSDPAVLKLPMEAGLYWLRGNDAVQLELKPVVTSKAGGGKISILKKNHAIGSLAGASAKGLFPSGNNIVYARLQVAVEDLVLVQLELDDDRRNLDFGTKPAKPVFPPGAVKQFEAKDVGLGVVRIIMPPLPKGQYLFLILGSGEEKKGTLGKGWEFGVE